MKGLGGAFEVNRRKRERKGKKGEIKIERRREITDVSDGDGGGGGWCVARALVEMLPAVTMVTGSHGACVVQPVSVN